MTPTGGDSVVLIDMKNSMNQMRSRFEDYLTTVSI